jgi:molybdopterin adenylyltransferase
VDRNCYHVYPLGRSKKVYIIMIRAGVLTLSDKSSRGESVDESGNAIKEILAAQGAHVLKYKIVPDERGIISAGLAEWADKKRLDCILTASGKGLTPRDVTPEATLRGEACDCADKVKKK